MILIDVNELVEADAYGVFNGFDGIFEDQTFFRFQSDVFCRFFIHLFLIDAGSVIMSYPSDVLRELAPEAREMLGIPESHYMKLIVGFGYPEIPYARGTQKGGHKVHRWTDISKGQLPLL